ncbi:aldolase/citrate lyase family protein [Herbiconiux sp. KACC 21604]|uniref:HpcH/HpaI aldolase family protein n=1 Tax=unclassified Herbiconiux TaxID=2618217 RepID=UPI001493054E|nr:aldolase/citrate lyase family protein [Herbiconiux sp. SALV-R1]QJU54974.1 hypothetical protein HL652_16005 [Herbiconiux sp. SALV-R1]WPO86100.1 aldolase/citrate lyase family protein [Herbiconiux sp. KACC 21604]
MREALAGRPLLGTFVKLPRPEVVDVLAGVGYDFIVVDLEHGQASYAEARETLLAARANGVQALVRIGHLDPALANRLLEAGASGIQLSTVTSSAQATAFVRALRYQPVGDRSISLAQPAARYGAVAMKPYLDAFTSAPLAVGQLETAAFDDPLDDILTPLEVAFIGPADLSVAAGTPGDIASGVAARVIAEIEQSAARTGTLLGTFVANAEGAAAAAASGYRYIVIGSDLAVLGRAAGGQIAAAEAAVEAVRSGTVAGPVAGAAR